jgi:hypothetical protein
MFEVENRVPLEGWQKTRLIVDCIPFIFFVVLTIVYMTFLQDQLKDDSLTIFVLFMGLLLLVMGFQAVQRLRDLLSGVALVKDDLLERSWRSSGRGSATYHGKFEKMGRLRIIKKAHFQSQSGQRYRVVYSPVSRIVWTLEPLNS